MSTQDYFVLTSAQRDSAIGFNTEELIIDARAVGNGSPGVGLNLNDTADGFRCRREVGRN